MSDPKKLSAIDEVKKNINALSAQFKLALPPHVSVEKFVRTVLTAVQTTPALIQADRPSLYAAAMKSASAGLLPDGKEAALVPFKGQVQFLPMISGLLKQVRNSGELSMITSNVVYANDVFRYGVDSDHGERLQHEPILFGDRGDLIGAYALARLKDGAVFVEVMSAQQVNDVRNVSRAKDGPAWSGDFMTEMWRKTALRRLVKRLPVSTDKVPAIDSEDDDFNFNNHGRDAISAINDVPKVEGPSTKRGSRLESAILGDQEAELVELDMEDSSAVEKV